MTKHIFIQLGFYVSNLQKVQLNTDLFSETREYLYTEKLVPWSLLACTLIAWSLLAWHVGRAFYEMSGYSRWNLIASYKFLVKCCVARAIYV